MLNLIEGETVVSKEFLNQNRYNKISCRVRLSICVSRKVLKFERKRPVLTTMDLE